MNKIVVPSILIMTVLVAGIFAFMPIEKATTVHTSLATDIDDQNRVMTWTIESGAANYVIIPTGNSITGTAILSNIDGPGTCELRLGAGVDNDGPIDNLALGATAVATLTDQDGASIAIETATSTCTLTIFIETAAD